MTVVSGPDAEQYVCTSCGAALEFAPGTTTLTCPYCRATQQVAPAAGEGAAPAGLAKHDYVAYTQVEHQPVASLPPFTVSCRGCGSTTSTTALSQRCAQCQAPIVAVGDLGGELKPVDAIVPFVVDQKRALEEFRSWIKSRWFAPNALKKVATTASLRGGYLPHWGFDDETTSDYAGERGDYYYTTETYTTTENGQSVTRTREVRHTAWHPASGRVQRDFVDILAPGVNEPDHETLEKLGPWGVEQATPFTPEYLAGFATPRYDQEAASGFQNAKEQMAAVIHNDIESDIGGDEQRVHTVQTYDHDVLFRLLLLPLWFATYMTAGATYHVFINANTGEVIGERPYSKVKIAATVVGVILLAVIGYLIYRRSQQ
jgi:hypothetical protein